MQRLIEDIVGIRNRSQLARRSNAHLDSKAKYVSLQASDRPYESTEISSEVFADQFSVHPAPSISDQPIADRTK